MDSVTFYTISKPIQNLIAYNMKLIQGQTGYDIECFIKNSHHFFPLNVKRT